MVQKFIKGRKKWLRAKRLNEISRATYSMNKLVEKRRKI